MNRKRQVLIGIRKNMEYYRDSVKALFNQPISQMTIYCYYYGMTPNFCDSEEEIAAFEASNKVSFVMPYVVEYIGNFAGKTDVIRKTIKNGQVTYYTLLDSEHYAIYSVEESKKVKKHVWNCEEGTLEDTYSAFRERGIIFENDIYQKAKEEEQQLILSMKDYVQNRKEAV